MQANADARALSEEERERRRRARSELVPVKYKGKRDDVDDDHLKYLTDLNEEEVENVQQKCKEHSFIVIDPGKRDLFTAMKVDENDPERKPKILRYSYRQHLRETKRLKYQRIIRNHMKEERQRLEEVLSYFNGKTVNSIAFQAIIKVQTDINRELLPLYEDLKFRQYRWYGYLERRRAEDKMINRVKDKFGKDVIVFYGDWSTRYQMRSFAPTPNNLLYILIFRSFKSFFLSSFSFFSAFMFLILFHACH